MSTQPQPALSVVLPCDDLETSTLTLEHLQAQDALDVTELILVGDWEAEAPVAPVDLSGAWGVQWIAVGAYRSRAAAAVEGVRVARARVVVFAEPHAYPQPGWARALIDAHSAPYAAVGPSITNANPTRALSWANLLMWFGPFVEATEAAELDQLAGHNCSYKLDVLLDYEHDLDAMLEAETLLHRKMVGDGHRLRLEPTARVAHLNTTSLRPWVPTTVATGRLFAAVRSRDWSRRRRLLYVLGSPFIPAVAGARLVRPWRRARRAQRVPLSTVPLLLIGLFAYALGELLGYAAGEGTARRVRRHFELHREAYVVPADAEALQREAAT